MLNDFRSQQTSPDSTSSNATKRSGFHVPDDDIESVSDDSEPDSCLIVKANPRTFSVPSSGDEAEETSDEDVVISTSRRTYLAKKDPSPDGRQPSRPSADPYLEADRQSPRAASSAQPGTQDHPVALRESPPVADDVINADSEDERPDATSEEHGQQQPPTEPDVAADSMSMTNIPDTYQLLLTSDVTGTQHGRMSEDEDYHDYTGGIATNPEPERAGNEANFGKDSHPSSASEPSIPHIARALFPHTESTQGYLSVNDSQQDDDDVTNHGAVERTSVFSHINTNQDQSAAPPALTGSAARSPKAMNHTEMQAAYDEYLVRPRTSGVEYNLAEPQPQSYEIYPSDTTTRAYPSTRARAPSPSDAALARKATLDLAENDKPFLSNVQNSAFPGPNCHNSVIRNFYNGSSYGLPQARYHGDTQYGVASTASHRTMPTFPSQVADDWHVRPAEKVSGQKSKVVEYEQGPFSRGFGSIYSTANTSFAETQPDADITSGTVTRPMSPPRQKKCLVRLKVENKSTNEKRSSASDQKLGSAVPRRVAIANLVNSQIEKSRSLKRKSDLMSSDEPVDSTLRTTCQAPSVTVAPTVPQELADGLAKATAHAAEGEPARKKVKTTTSTAATIGGLISGVCLGFAGAMAAFIAAIPADVREEAMREVANLG